MTTKGKVLVLVSSGHGLPLKDGKVYTGAGYYLNELTVPVRALMNEGYELRIIKQGRTDSPDSTSLYVPSIGLIVAGDVVYNQCRMYVGDTTPESRKNWIAALDRLAALNPTMVVAGHKKPGAPDSPSTIQDTKRYLEDFDRLQKTAKSDQELFDQMTELYPHWVANQSWLMFGFPGA